MATILLHDFLTIIMINIIKTTTLLILLGMPELKYTLSYLIFRQQFLFSFDIFFMYSMMINTVIRKTINDAIVYFLLK